MFGLFRFTASRKTESETEWCNVPQLSTTIYLLRFARRMMAGGSKSSIISDTMFSLGGQWHQQTLIIALRFCLFVCRSIHKSRARYRNERTSLRWREKLLVPGNATVIFHTLNPCHPSQELGNSQWTMTLSIQSTWRSSSPGYIAWVLVFSFPAITLEGKRGERFSARL